MACKSSYIVSRPLFPDRRLHDFVGFDGLSARLTDFVAPFLQVFGMC